MREVIDVGENAQKIGKKLEQLGVNLLGMFKWNKKMSDKEIKCTRSTHKNAENLSRHMGLIYTWSIKIHT